VFGIWFPPSATPGVAGSGIGGELTDALTDRIHGDLHTTSGVAEALARVQEAVIDVKEGALPQALEAAIETIDSAVREVPDKPEADQLNAVAEALEDALEEVEKGKVANLLPALEEAKSIVESGSSREN
jgi:hypothetical protein